MTFVVNVVKFPIYLVIGTILFILSPGFRTIVRIKLQDVKEDRVGPDEPVSAGEQVIAVLETDQKKEFIGG